MGKADYAFVSDWVIHAPREATWAFLTGPDQRWSDWWPGLRSVTIERTDALVGSTAACQWSSPWRYTVGMALEVVEIEPGRRVDLSVRGDLVGHGVVTFADRDLDTRTDRRSDHCAVPPGTATDVTTHWTVTTTPTWMRVLAPVLRPVFTMGHHVVMRRGERGLDRALTTARTTADRW